MHQDDKNNKIRGAETPRVLLIQPPIYDFAAFDFYLYPLGLLNFGQALNRRGYDADLLDALDRYAAIPKCDGLTQPTFRTDGCGHFHRKRIQKPPHLESLPRRFHRFGLPQDYLEQKMAQVEAPDVVAIGCAMTYWYPGVVEMAEISRKLWPGVPLILGGTYATLCEEHAKKTLSPDFIQKGSNLEPLFEFLSNRVGAASDSTVIPGHFNVGARTSAAVQASWGCPGRCPYCASFILGGPFRRRPVDEVVQEIEFCINEQGRKQIAFYDDSLLEGDENPFNETVAKIMAKGLHQRATFHCPNALRATSISAQTALDLKRCNFRTIRIGFETSDIILQKELGQKASNSDLSKAVTNLLQAGFETKDLGVYIIMGMPDQDTQTVDASIRFVNEAGALSRLAEYSPVPGTPFFERSKTISLLDLDEPINHNKTLAPFRFPDFGMEETRFLKDLSHLLNNSLLQR